MIRKLSLLFLLLVATTLVAAPAVTPNTGPALVVSGITVNGQLFDAHFVWGNAAQAQASAKTFVGSGHLHEVTTAVNAILTAQHITAVTDVTGAHTSTSYAIPEVFYADRPFLIDVGQWRQDGNWYANYASYVPYDAGFSSNREGMWVELTKSVPVVQSVVTSLMAWAILRVVGVE